MHTFYIARKLQCNFFKLLYYKFSYSFQMDISELIITIIFICTSWTNILFVYTFPTSNTGVVEFFMSRSNRTALHTYGLREAFDIVFKSKNCFGDLKSCPTEVKNGTELLVNERSTCPWYYEVNRDPERYPEIILNAVTPCTNSCIGRDDNFQCYPVTRKIQVLKFKEEFNAAYRIYLPNEIAITVGFTCGSRRMAVNITPPSVTTAFL